MQSEMAQISKSSLEQVLLLLENVTRRVARRGYALRFRRSAGQEKWMH
jgi:hypothetical protein